MLTEKENDRSERATYIDGTQFTNMLGQFRYNHESW